MRHAVCIAMVAALGCAAEVDQQETKQGAVSGVGPFTSMSAPLVQYASPAFARALGQGWTAFAWGVDDNIYTTYETSPGSGVFRSTWIAVGPGSSPNAPASQPVVAVMPNGSYMIAIRRFDNQIVAQVQDQTGLNIYNPWHVVSGGALFNSGPAIAVNKAPTAPFGSQNPTIMIVARGSDDRLYSMRNVSRFTSGLYSPLLWGAPVQVSGNVYTSSPAITVTCGTNYPSRSSYNFVAAAQYAPDNTYHYMFHDGGNWTFAAGVVGGVFHTGPALACANNGTTQEISLWGLSQSQPQPNQHNLLFSSQISGGPPSFGTVVFPTFGNNIIPTVAGFGNTLRIGVVMSNSPNTPGTAPANSP